MKGTDWLIVLWAVLGILNIISIYFIRKREHDNISKEE